MSTFVATLALDGSADPTRMDLINLVIGDQEQRTLRIDGFEAADSGVSVTLIAKTDFVDDDNDPDTLQIVATTLTTPTRDPGSRLATFVITSDDTRELALGRIHRVIVTLTRSAVQYTKTVATGFIAAVTPGATATAPSDEATLRAAGDASVLSAITDKIDSVTGTADRITIGGTATAPTVDIASTYAGQPSINTLGTVTAGVWNGTSIDTAHTAAKVVAVAGVSGRTSIGGTASNPTIDVDAAYPGQASIVTLGTVSTGTWNATTIAANKGGTGLTGFGAIGAMLYAATITTLAVLSGNTTTAKKFLNQTGDGVNSAAPAWAQIVSADVSDATSANTASRVVVRDSSGNFSAGTITATSFSGTHNGAVVGNVTGNTTGTHTGDVVGNSSTATTFQTARTINGVSFNGSANITVTADASTLTGASLNAGVSVLPSQITGLLSGGLINPALLPALAISETFTVASQAAMLALTAQKGDVAVRSDTSTTFILSGTDPTQLSNWTLLATPVSSVLSVAGKTGVVTLVSADITDATSTNTGSRLVLRDGSGNFAAGTITAALSGNASTATALFNTRTIWGQSFNGTADITGPITATAATISGAINAGTHIRTTGTLTTNVASSAALDYAGGFGRMVVQGPDTSTLGQFLVTLTKSDGSSALGVINASAAAVTTNALLNAAQGIQIAGPATLGVTAAALLSYEAPITRIYVGDGTGYSVRFAKRVGSATTDLVTITDAGAVIAPRIALGPNDTAHIAVTNAAGHNAPFIGNKLDFLGSGSADDVVIAAFGSVTIFPGNGVVATLAVSSGAVAVAGALNVAGTSIALAAGGAENRLTLGSSVSGDFATIRMLVTPTQFSWQIGASALTANAIEFVPSTVVGGSIFSTPVMTLGNDGTLTTIGTIKSPASTTARAGLRIAHGTAPTSPTDGDMWSTTAGAFIRINGVTKTFTLT